MSLVKRFQLDQMKCFDVRIEMFNALNWVNNRAPNAVFGTSTFGIIDDASDRASCRLRPASPSESDR